MAPDDRPDRASQSRPRGTGAGTEPVGLVVTVDTGERIHYLDWGPPTGAGRPGAPAPDADSAVDRVAERPGVPLVLLHGLAQTSWAWAPVARRLSRRNHVVAVDLRGHGLSEAPRDGYDVASLAFDALTVMTAAGWGDDAGGPPAIVAGHGFGGLVAATMAALRPRSIAGVALVDGGWEDVGASTGLSVDEFLRAIEEPPEVLSSMDAYLADRREWHEPSWDADQERAARSTVVEKHAGHVALVARPHVLRAIAAGMFEYDALATLTSFAAPVLAIAAESGSADDDAARGRRLALEDVVRERSATGATTRVVRFVGAGHNLMRYRPDELVAELERFADEAITSGRRLGGPA